MCLLGDTSVHELGLPKAGHHNLNNEFERSSLGIEFKTIVRLD